MNISLTKNQFFVIAAAIFIAVFLALNFDSWLNGETKPDKINYTIEMYSGGVIIDVADVREWTSRSDRCIGFKRYNRFNLWCGDYRIIEK